MAKNTVVKDETKEITFSYKDVEYKVPAPKLWPIEVVEAQESGRNLGAFKELLGDEQYKTFRKSIKTMGDLDEAMEVLLEAVELELGE